MVNLSDKEIKLQLNENDMIRQQMIQKITSPLLLLSLLLCFSTSYAENRTKALLYEIKSDTAVVYLLGSIHFADDSLYPLNPAIEKRFEESSQLVLEIDPTAVDDKEVQSYVLKRGYYHGSESVVDHTNPEVFRLLENYVNTNGLPAAAIYKMKPGMIALTLSTMQLQRLGYSPDKGIDLYFAKKANQLGKPIVSLESIQDQLNMLLTMPNEKAFLQYTLLDLENLEHFMNEIITAWKSGDASSLYQILIAPYENKKEYQPIIRKLLYNRNLRMASQIRKFLKSDQTWFVVVGAGHLLGDKGLISLLEKKNYTIIQLEHEKE